MSRSAWTVAAERLYRLALLAYPHRVRRAYGELLRVTFRDRLRAAARRGAGTLLLICLVEFADLAATAARERRDAALASLHPRALLRPGLLLGGLLGLLWLVPVIFAYVTPAGNQKDTYCWALPLFHFSDGWPHSLLLVALPLAATLAGFSGGRRTRGITAGMREGVVVGLLGTAMLAATIVALLQFWMPAVEYTDLGPALYAGSATNIEAFEWSDNLVGLAWLGIFAAVSGLICGGVGGALGRLVVPRPAAR
jgi:hypothetical protein